MRRAIAIVLFLAACGAVGASKPVKIPRGTWCRTIHGDNGDASLAAPASTLGELLPGPPKPSEMEQAAARAGVPVLDNEAVATHLHTELVVFVDGSVVSVPEGIGIDVAHGHIAALHTHFGDMIGRFHVESPNEGDSYTLCQALAMWGIRATDAAVCDAFTLTAPPSCTVTITDSQRRANGYETILRNADVIMLTVGATRGT